MLAGHLEISPRPGSEAPPELLCKSAIYKQMRAVFRLLCTKGEGLGFSLLSFGEENIASIVASDARAMEWITYAEQTINFFW